VFLSQRLLEIAEQYRITGLLTPAVEFAHSRRVPQVRAPVLGDNLGGWPCPLRRLGISPCTTTVQYQSYDATQTIFIKSQIANYQLPITNPVTYFAGTQVPQAPPRRPGEPRTSSCGFH
jgi:hypothetical protein